MENFRKKIIYLLRYYIVQLFFFILLRMIFMSVNSTEEYTLTDYLESAWHGIPLDAAVAGYITVIPLLLTMVSTFVYIPMRKLLIVYNLFAAIAISLAFIADITLYPFWEFKLDASFLIYIDSPSNAFASVSTSFIVLRILMAAALAAALYSVLHFVSPSSLRPTKHRFLSLLTTTIIGGLLFLAIRGGIGESTNNIGKVYYSEKTFLNHSAVNPVFSFIYSLGKREDYSEAYHFYNDEELDRCMQGMFSSNSAIVDTLLRNRRPNIITIILEGMSSALIGELGGKSNITPNFDNIIKEGVIFSNCHANSYRTDRGIISSLSGYASFPKTSVMKSPVKSRNLPSLASSLGKAGYHNTFLYGGDINFTNMKSYLYSTGYNKLIADKDFTLQQQETHLWGVTDHITFDSLYTIVQNSAESPWHITYLTLSSHEPWTVPYNRIPDDAIANSFAYTDSCIGNFIGRLKKSDVWDNTLVIFIADHTLARYPERREGDDAMRNKIPFLLTGGAIREARDIPILCNQSDLPATLLAQLELPIDDFTFSRNILSPTYTYPFAYHTFNNGFSYIDSTGYTLYDLDAYVPVIEQPAMGAEERLQRAKAILQTTYKDFSKR
ncbi:MAG: sulfatase-like hydrolase/transferase [Bacteroidaceae bacterium]|nr:sulfatase-like hydrolase/transferase [Bacteroidaceae bacterium]